MWLGCNDYTYPPQFKIPKESIIADIQKMISAETIHIEGYMMPIGDSVSLLLNVGINNPKNLLTDDALLDMQKRIAVLVKNALKDPNQFKVYDIGIMKSKVTSENFWSKTIEAESMSGGQFDVDDL
jgi:hypothetical protein